MRILVLGNGFDIAHGLPTGTEEFLKAMGEKKLDEELYGESYNELCEYHDKEGYLGWLELAHQLIEEGDRLLWDGLESEISKCIQFWDRVRINSLENPGYLQSGDLELLSKYEFYSLHFDASNIAQDNDDEIALALIHQGMLNSLNEMTRALEIYLKELVQTKDIDRLPFFEKYKPDKVINFNYTNTVERLYAGMWGNPEIYHIHGQVKDDSTLKTCNLVFGIDEYLNSMDSQNDNYFIQFKKFYQRIIKKTGSAHREWLEDRASSARRTREELYVDFYGHSLSKADGDVIKELIQQKNTFTTIHYLNQKSLGEIVANLVAILGEEELIQRTGGSGSTIFFKEIEKNPSNI